MAEDPTEQNKRALHKAFLSMPKHRRRFILGDQDAKAGPILSLLSDEQGPNFEGARQYFVESDKFESTEK